MWMIFVFFIGMIFVAIGIAKNKDGEYIKKGAFSAMIISILASMLFLYSAIALQGGAAVIGFGFFDIAEDKVYLLFNSSIIIAFLSLIVYLFSDYQS